MQNNINYPLYKKTTSLKGWSDGCDYWLEDYSVEQIKQAMTNCKNSNWWGKDGFTLALLFRRRNKSGDCDYIDELLNVKIIKERVIAI